MTELTITVRDDDMPTLTAMAEHQWRTEQQQACALIEQVLQKARADPNRRTRTVTRRNGGVSRSNGVARVEV